MVICIAALCLGPTTISLKRIISVIFGEKGSIEHTIIISIRLPRILLGIAVGGGLSLSGVLLLGIFKNPLVSPYTLGISGGAALGVCINIVWGFGNTTFTLPFSGFLGAILVIVILYQLSLKRGILKINGLLLSGVMISFISTSLILLLMSVTKAENLYGIFLWTMGSLGEPDIGLIILIFIISIAGLIVSYFYCLKLNAFWLGEEGASHLGVNTESVKRVVLLTASIITGCCVSVAGIIGFVGLVVPHFIRMYIGQDHRVLLISAFLAGGGFLIVCDTLARTVISPNELPVGVITGLFGGVLFLYALTRRGVRL